MVIFSDGQDTQVSDPRQDASTEIVAGAAQAKIPVYLIRTSYNKALGARAARRLWKPAVEATGGKFYAAGDEATILSAIKEIDRRSAGRSTIKQYSTQQPQFAASPSWRRRSGRVALALQLTVPYFRKFP